MNMALTVVFFAGAHAPRGARSSTQRPILGTLGGPDVQATGINSSGQVIGNADGEVSGTGFAFLWTAPGPMVSLGALGSLPTQSNATGINDSSWVVGQSNNEGFVYTPQTGMQGLGLLPGGTLSQAYCVNNAGVISGVSATVGSTYLHPFVWTASGGMTDLDTTITNMPSSWTPTSASLINNAGLVAGIGYAELSTYPPSGAEHAFTLNGGTLQEIADPGTAIYPKAINSNGEVVGYYTGQMGRHLNIRLWEEHRDLGASTGCNTRRPLT